MDYEIIISIIVSLLFIFPKYIDIDETYEMSAINGRTRFILPIIPSNTTLLHLDISSIDPISIYLLDEDYINNFTAGYEFLYHLSYSKKNITHFHLDDLVYFPNTTFGVYSANLMITNKVHIKYQIILLQYIIITPLVYLISLIVIIKLI